MKWIVSLILISIGAYLAKVLIKIFTADFSIDYFGMPDIEDLEP